MHTSTRNCFVAIKQIFTLSESVQEYSHRTNIQCMRTQPEQVVEDTSNLIEHDTDILRANRHFNTHELFNRHHICMLVGHHGHIIQTIHIGHRLQISTILSELFSGSMQETDMRVSALNHFAIKLQHQTQHAMRCWVLWTKVHGVITNLSHCGNLRRVSSVVLHCEAQ